MNNEKDFYLIPEVEFLRKEIFRLWQKENEEIFSTFSESEKVVLENHLYNTGFESYRPSFIRLIKFWVDKIMQGRGKKHEEV